VITVVLKSVTCALIVSRCIYEKVGIRRNLADNRSICQNFFFYPVNLICQTVVNYFVYVKCLSAFVVCKAFKFTNLFWICRFSVAGLRYKTSSLTPWEHSINVSSFAWIACLVTIKNLLRRESNDLLASHTYSVFNGTYCWLNVAWGAVSIDFRGWISAAVWVLLTPVVRFWDSHFFVCSWAARFNILGIG
jgi:hypothetical protein